MTKYMKSTDSDAVMPLSEYVVKNNPKFSECSKDGVLFQKKAEAPITGPAVDSAVEVEVPAGESVVDDSDKEADEAAPAIEAPKKKSSKKKK